MRYPFYINTKLKIIEIKQFSSVTSLEVDLLRGNFSFGDHLRDLMTLRVNKNANSKERNKLILTFLKTRVVMKNLSFWTYECLSRVASAIR